MNAELFDGTWRYALSQAGRAGRRKLSTFPMQEGKSTTRSARKGLLFVTEGLLVSLHLKRKPNGPKMTVAGFFKGQTRSVNLGKMGQAASSGVLFHGAFDTDPCLIWPDLTQGSTRRWREHNPGPAPSLIQSPQVAKAHTPRFERRPSVPLYQGAAEPTRAPVTAQLCLKLIPTSAFFIAL